MNDDKQTALEIVQRFWVVVGPTVPQEFVDAIATALVAARRDEAQRVWGDAINVANYAAQTMQKFAAKDAAAASKEREKR